MEEEGFNGMCKKCGGGRFVDGHDGFYYCVDCHHQSQDVMDTGVADEDFLPTAGAGEQSGGFYLASHRHRQPAVVPGIRAGAPVIKAEPISQFMPDNYMPRLFDESGMKKEEAVVGDELSGPLDFGFTTGYEADDEARYKCTYNEVRMRYVMGIQLMLEMQCKALVESFGVTPLICGLASSIWLRFVAASQIFDDDWADNAISESEVRNSGLPEDIEHPPRFYREFRNSHGERAIMIWYKSLRKMIPLSSSLAVSYLACHVARESVLSTDILKGTLEGKLPYLAAFTEIEKLFSRHSNVFPLSANFMFRASEVVPVQKLEAMAAQVADAIGLELSPVNFHAIASRYLKQMSLPVEKILHHADRVVDWSVPAELWLSVNESRLPSRIYVMAVLIVSIRILYNIHGFGVWENSLCNHERWFESNVSSQPGSECEQNDVYPSCGMGESPLNSKGSSMQDKDSRLDGGELLSNLQAIYEKLQNRYEYSKDLPTYLNYCKDVIFVGTGLSNDDEKTITEEFWDIYHDKQEGNDEDGPNEDSITREPKYRDFETPHDVYSNDSKRAAYSDVGLTLSAHCESPHLDDQSEQSHGDDHNSPRRSAIPPSCAANEEQVASKISKDEAINRIKAEMEENRFCYIPPRVNVKRHDYLHYVRKKDEGAYTYVAHADYYILLRACARVAQVDIRIMHVGVMNLERQLAWIEKRIDHCLNLRHPDVDDDHVDDYNGSVQQHECSEEVSFSE